MNCLVGQTPISQQTDDSIVEALIQELILRSAENIAIVFGVKE